MFQKNIILKKCFKKYLKHFNNYVEKIKNISNGVIAFKNNEKKKHS